MSPTLRRVTYLPLMQYSLTCTTNVTGSPPLLPSPTPPANGSFGRGSLICPVGWIGYTTPGRWNSAPKDELPLAEYPSTSSAEAILFVDGAASFKPSSSPSDHPHPSYASSDQRSHLFSMMMVVGAHEEVSSLEWAGETGTGDTATVG